ncbi:hypothetical protein [Parvibaculum sp.]|uniref:hypothetical protein n=1 Tax=Parvibaculum sp. TaxID=2024848 RepID=UPI0032972B53
MSLFVVVGLAVGLLGGIVPIGTHGEGTEIAIPLKSESGGAVFSKNILVCGDAKHPSAIFSRQESIHLCLGQLIISGKIKFRFSGWPEIGPALRDGATLPFIPERRRLNGDANNSGEALCGGLTEISERNFPVEWFFGAPSKNHFIWHNVNVGSNFRLPDTSGLHEGLANVEDAAYSYESLKGGQNPQPNRRKSHFLLGAVIFILQAASLLGCKMLINAEFGALRGKGRALTLYVGGGFLLFVVGLYGSAFLMIRALVY